MNVPGHISTSILWPQGAEIVKGATPLSFGIDLPAGRVSETCPLQVETANGIRLSAQGTVLGRWHDGSARWLLVDCVAPAGTRLQDAWQVRFDRDASVDCKRTATIEVEDQDHAVVVRREEWSLSFDKSTGTWAALKASKPVAKGELPQLTDAHGRKHVASKVKVSIEASGPIRATITVEGCYHRAGGLRVVARWSMFAGTELLEGDITLHNPRRAKHKGGLWDLGDSGSILLKDFTQAVSLVDSKQSEIRLRCEAEQEVRTANDRVEIYQESSGGDNWNSRNHVNRLGNVPMKMKGYVCKTDGEALTALRAQPIVEISSGNSAVSVEIEHFWQQFPKAIECRDGEVQLRLFPGQFGDLYELQGGEQKTHRIWLKLGSTSIANRSLPTNERHQARSLSLKAIPGLPDWNNVDAATMARFDQLAEEFLSGPRGLYANRELVDEYGWRNWGDLHADHEEQHYRGPQPLISHYNNQFDVVQGFLLQYLRTGDSRWMDLAEPLARHVIDIDIYHTSQDRPAYSGGLFWFTDHYLHAETSSHRTYSRKNAPRDGSYGGGPSACHNFTTGLLLYHLLTGNPLAREAVLSLANWVIAQDDGSRTVFGLVDDGPTGMASATSSASDHRPGRAAGNSINALLDAWVLTNDVQYLQYAESLIRRCVHPRQDIDSLSLLDAEKHWSYTVFLVSLDKYLQAKFEAGQLDENYDYALASLEHYGRWMAANERPYLERPEKLEYPTEAWAAQEFRKANILRLAARYADARWANAMRQTGKSLADRAWSDLLQFPTRTTARAMAVVLVEGILDAQLRCDSARISTASSRIVDATNFPPPLNFLPQRERIKKQLRTASGVTALLATASCPNRWPRILNHR